MTTFEEFKKDTVKKLQKKLNIKNINAVPKIQKVVVAIGIGSLATRKSLKDFDEFEKNIIKITWQKPILRKSKKAISNFKLREWLPVMYQSTLRNRRAYDFLDRFVKLVLPRIRDFNWLSVKSFDWNGNMNIWIPNYNVFPELTVEDVVNPIWIQITIVTSTKDNVKAKALLEETWLIFK